MVPDYEDLVVSESDGVVRVAFDNPDRLNALTRTMSEELLDVATRYAEDDTDARALVLTGHGDAFCSGGDLTSLVGASPPAGFRKGASLLHDAVVQFHQGGLPIVVAVNGPAVGAGFGFACMGDLVYVADDAYLQYGYPNVGMTGDGGSTFYLPRLVGLREAKRIALRNPKLSPEEAVEVGLATDVVPAEDLEDRVDEVAADLADGPTVALRRTNRLLTESLGRSIEQQLAAETEGMAHAARTEDFQEGIAAFAEKRDPEFEGK